MVKVFSRNRDRAPSGSQDPSGDQTRFDDRIPVLGRISPRNRILLASAALIVVAGILAWRAGAGHGGVDFNQDVRPILNERCVTCHGGVRRESDLSLLFRADALEPAQSGRQAIVPGRPGKSELIRRVTHTDPEERMPLEHPPLSKEEISVLRRWIEQGAPWDPHWAYVAPIEKPLPEVSDPNWPQGGIDRFVLAELDQKGLRPSPRADCAVLLRRTSLDLTGLPPSPEEADAFCHDPSPEHLERAVDRMLASPQFGERWAGYWLDLARYADTNGYEKDEHRTIWKYRDWVIQAFNANVPFDQFSTSQLAGDLLPNPDDQLVATAFHRNTMTNTEGGTDDEEFRLAAVMDRLNTTFEVWQSTTISCAQCHGHPYDPFRQTEFYDLLAFFDNTADADRHDNEPKLYHFDREPERGHRLVAELEATTQRMHESVDPEEFVAWLERFESYARDADRVPRFDGRALEPHVIRLGQKEAADRSPNDVAVLRDLYLDISPTFEALRQERTRLRESIAALDPVTTPVIRELPPEASRTTYVFERGNRFLPGRQAEHGVPHALPDLPDGAPANRLGLARWLFAPDNPLTARVTVNRFWEQLFGTGLVKTVEDFGTQGDPPTHPALLDWLALRFSQELGWSVKALLKEIVASATYQQSSRVSPELLELDPYNEWLARGPRFRLSAEHIRDQALAVSGLLSNKMLGPSVFPPQPPGLWRNPYSTMQWVTSEGEDRYRRALYTYWRRTVPYPSMLAFDAMSRELCTSRRIRTNSPLQSLVTLNDPVYVEAAVALAGRMRAEGGDSVESQLRRGYRLALQREISDEALHSLLELYEVALESYRQRPEDAAALLHVKELAFPDYVQVVKTDYGATPVAEPSAPAPPEGSATPEEGALAVAANVLLNLDAFLTKE